MIIFLVNIIYDFIFPTTVDIKHSKFQQVEAEAKRIAEDAKRLLETNNQLLSDMQDRRIQLQDLLNRAEAQQQQVLKLYFNHTNFTIITSY